MFLRYPLACQLTFLADPVALCQLCHVPLPPECRGFQIGVSRLTTTQTAIKTDLVFYSPTLSYQRLQTVQPLSDEELYDKIRRSVPNKQELQVLESFLIFNKSVYSPFLALVS